MGLEAGAYGGLVTHGLNMRMMLLGGCEGIGQIALLPIEICCGHPPIARGNFEVSPPFPDVRAPLMLSREMMG